jgi:hypothetical protein
LRARRGKPLMRFQQFAASAYLQQISLSFATLSRPGENRVAPPIMAHALFFGLSG